MTAFESQRCMRHTQGEIIRTKITLQIEDFVHGIILIVYRLPVRISKARKIPAANIAVDTEWDNSQKPLAWKIFKKILRTQDVINEAKVTNRYYHFAVLMDLSYLKHAELTGHLQTYRGQTDIVRRPRQRRHKWLC